MTTRDGEAAIQSEPALPTRRIVLASFAGMVGGGIVLGPAAADMAELFATGHRYTAAGMSYNVATIIGGGVQPVLAAGLVAAYGSGAIGVMLGVYGVLSIICGLALPETMERSLRTVGTSSATDARESAEPPAQ
jgi:MFS family permease